MKVIGEMSDQKLMEELLTHENLGDSSNRYTVIDQHLIEIELNKRGYDWERVITLKFFQTNRTETSTEK